MLNMFSQIEEIFILCKEKKNYFLFFYKSYECKNI